MREIFADERYAENNLNVIVGVGSPRFVIKDRDAATGEWHPDFSDDLIARLTGWKISSAGLIKNDEMNNILINTSSFKSANNYRDKYNFVTSYGTYLKLDIAHSDDYKINDVRDKLESIETHRLEGKSIEIKETKAGKTTILTKGRIFYAVDNTNNTSSTLYIDLIYHPYDAMVFTPKDLDKMQESYDSYITKLSGADGGTKLITEQFSKYVNNNDISLNIIDRIVELPHTEMLIERYKEEGKSFDMWKGRKFKRIDGFRYSAELDYSSYMHRTVLEAMQPIFTSKRRNMIFYPRIDNDTVFYYIDLADDYELEMSHLSRHLGHRGIKLNLIGLDRLSTVPLDQLKVWYGYGSLYGGLENFGYGGLL